MSGLARRGDDPEPLVTLTPVPGLDSIYGDLALVRAERGQDMPEGPVALWAAALDDGGQMLGLGRLAGQPRWEWRGGALAAVYVADAPMVARTPGRWVATAVVAVNWDAQAYRVVHTARMARVHEVRPGEHLMLADLAVLLYPETRRG